MPVTDPPPPTSPEVADACRRAGLPYRPDDRGMNAAAVGMASPRAGSPAAERAYDRLTDLGRQLDLAGQLYGPALAAPMAANVDALHLALEAWRGEVWESERQRDRLERSLDQAHDQVSEIAAERDRARDVAVALEQDRTGPGCLCGQPSTPNVVHRTDGPCHSPDAERPPPIDLFAGFPVILDPTLPPDVLELRGATTVRVRVVDGKIGPVTS